jgi:riboflavin synthase
MFTGIVEALGVLVGSESRGSSVKLLVESALAPLVAGQSIAHNGICLTVNSQPQLSGNRTVHEVVAVEETIRKTNLSRWQVGDLINLERAMPANGRFEGHLVQGHVDATAICVSVTTQNGNCQFAFEYPRQFSALVVPRGSVCINGISLTVAEETIRSEVSQLTVAIVPYTMKHTSFSKLQKGDSVNIEFDVLGKYLQRMYAAGWQTPTQQG